MLHRLYFRAALKFGAAFCLSVLLTLAVSSITAEAACDVDKGQARVPAPPANPQLSVLVPFAYAQTTFPTVPVYASPTDELAGIAPIRLLGNGFVWLSLADPTPVLANSSYWYHVNPEGYVHAESLKLFEPSAFHGATFASTPVKPIAWVVYGARVSSTPGAPPDKNSSILAKYSFVNILDEKKVGDWMWYKIGNNQWIEQRQVGVVSASPRPQGIGEKEKWIEVNLYEQTLAAYEGDRMVYATLVSSGLARWPTPRGLFQVWAKVTDWKMSGKEGLPDYYFLEDVPWILYFNKDVALHAAYWHDKFGAPRSHGCVNLSPADAKWLFAWATPTQGPNAWTLANSDNPGTWVWVH